MDSHATNWDVQEVVRNIVSWIHSLMRTGKSIMQSLHIQDNDISQIRLAG